MHIIQEEKEDFIKICHNNRYVLNKKSSTIYIIQEEIEHFIKIWYNNTDVFDKILALIRIQKKIWLNSRFSRISILHDNNNKNVGRK